MFTNISWTDYLVVITLLLAGYYLIMSLWLYPHELRNWLSGFLPTGLRPRPPKTLPAPAPPRSPTDFWEKLPEGAETRQLPEIPADNPITEKDPVTGYLQEVIAEAAAQASDKAAFIRLLQSFLQEHPDFQKTPFRITIQELVISESQKYAPVALSEAEVKALWPPEQEPSR